MFIKVDHISKTYALGRTTVLALSDISLTVAKGAFLSIAGKSGSGKTTLLNILGCIDTPSQGQYFMGGKEITQLSEQVLTQIRARHIGYIFQTFNLIPVLSAFENVEYPLLLAGSYTRKTRRERVHDYLHQVGLYDQRHQRPNQLSGGQRQRVAIARALVKMPTLILADEPTASLDSRTGFSIIELMQKLNQDYKVTFIFSSHDPHVIREADQVFQLQDGQLVHEVCQ